MVDQYMNEGDIQILVHHIARAFKEDLSEKMRLSPFLSVIVDAQNDDIFSDMVAVYIQFLTGEGSSNRVPSIAEAKHCWCDQICSEVI